MFNVFPFKSRQYSMSMIESVYFNRQCEFQCKITEYYLNRKHCLKQAVQMEYYQGNRFEEGHST